VEVDVRWIVCALVLALASPAAAQPRRIVSLDYCADQFVLALAERDQIAALSRGARRDDSYYRDRADSVRQTRGSLEEVLALSPDLVVRNWGGPWNAQEVYARFGVPVLQVGDAPDFPAARDDLMRAARAIGNVEQGRAILVDFDQRMARLRANTRPDRPPVMYLSAGGAVAGSSVLMNAVIEAAGGRNVHSEASWAVLPLERMVETPPALIALAFFDHRRTAVNAWLPGRHAAVRRALDQARTVSLAPATVSCEAWFALDAAEAIAAALRAP